MKRDTGTFARGTQQRCSALGAGRPGFRDISGNGVRATQVKETMPA
jgi:hypothetical protein